METSIYEKIVEKKEFSQLPKKDVELAFKQFDKERYADEEKIKLTRDLLRKVFSAFGSGKIMKFKNKDAEWFLRKHISTRERLKNYEKIYKRLLKDLQSEISIIDLGAGINGLSYKYFPCVVNYVGVESVGQLVA